MLVMECESNFRMFESYICEEVNDYLLFNLIIFVVIFIISL